MIAWGCLVGIAVTIMCIRILNPIAERLNLVDYPGGRKQHGIAKPLIGGIALFVGFSAAMLSLPISLIGYRPFASGALMLVFMGILDDMHELSPRARIIAEVIAGLLMAVWAKVALFNLGDLFFTGDIHLGWFAIPFTIFAIVGLINAVNMLDGSDGLAGTLTFTQLCLFLLVALQAHLPVEVGVILLLMSAVVGFLFYNFPISKKHPARVFMGDAGSMFLGYALSWFAIGLSQQSQHALYPVCVLWILSVTLWDALRVILSRVLMGKSPLKPDRNHLHHILQDRGFSSRQICLSVGGLNVMLGTVGVVAQWLGWTSPVLFVTYLAGFIVYCVVVQLLGVKRVGLESA